MIHDGDGNGDGDGGDDPGSLMPIAVAPFTSLSWSGPFEDSWRGLLYDQLDNSELS